MKKFDLVIKNGTVVTASDMFSADLGVKDGKIAAIAENIEADAEEVFDAAGKLVLPGALDVHTHLAMPFGGTISSDSYLSGTRAAACGGVTTVFDYPVQHTGETIRGVIAEKKAVLEKEACVDFASHCCITDLSDGAIIEEMEEAVKEGITSFKCFLVYKKEGWMVSDGTLAKLMLRAKELGAMINVHAENPDLIDMYTEQFLKEGKTSAWYHYMSRPEFVEAEADKRAVHWSKHLDAPLWKAIKNGSIDTVATDHCPFQSYEKDWGRDDFTKIPNGCSGIENLYPYMLDAANSGKISFSRAVELCSTNPAKIFGCDQKGSIAVGKDADIVIYDKDKDFTISVDTMHSDCDHTIWEGKKLHGYPVRTFLRGNVVYADGEFKGTPGMGQFVKRTPKKLR